MGSITDYLENKTILVTGGTGFLGKSKFISHLISLTQKIVYDHASTYIFDLQFLLRRY